MIILVLQTRAAPLRRTNNGRGPVRHRTQSVTSEDMMVEELLREVSDIDSRYASASNNGRGRVSFH